MKWLITVFGVLVILNSSCNDNETIPDQCSARSYYGNWGAIDSAQGVWLNQGAFDYVDTFDINFYDNGIGKSDELLQNEYMGTSDNRFTSIH